MSSMTRGRCDTTARLTLPGRCDVGERFPTLGLASRCCATCESCALLNASPTAVKGHSST
eukprot:scaffold258424_cov37-Tisochrysis_lutea.AAC.3